MNIKKTIAKWFKITEEDVKAINGYAPKKFGESRSVEYECDGLVQTFCKVTEWASGEGYDISIDSKVNIKTPEYTNKRIELHVDELETFFYCLKDLGYFE
jgi:hypothetical protein